MYHITLFAFTLSILYALCNTQLIYESDVNFRIEPGSRTCFFENGKAGHTMEIFYQVVDGQHGDLDISFDVIDPNGVKIVSDQKRSEKSIIMDLEVDGDYGFCMDNTYSVINSKLVFITVLIEAHDEDSEQEVEISEIDDDGVEHKVIEVIHWKGTYDNGEHYYIDVEDIAMSMFRIFRQMVRARQLLDIHRALKSRDSYSAFEHTFLVDIWPVFQIIFMFLVGLLQVYTIKTLFNQSHISKRVYPC